MLRLVEGDIRHGHHVVELHVDVLGADDADAAGELPARQLPALHGEPVEHQAEAPTDDPLVNQAVEQDQELVSAETADDVVRAEQLAQDVAHVDENLVSRTMAQRVVHGLEVVEVDKRDRAGGGGVRALQVRMRLLVERSLVVQVGQRIPHAQALVLRPQVIGVEPVAHHEQGHADGEQQPHEQLKDVVLRDKGVLEVRHDEAGELRAADKAVRDPRRQDEDGGKRHADQLHEDARSVGGADRVDGDDESVEHDLEHHGEHHDGAGREARFLFQHPGEDAESEHGR